MSSESLSAALEAIEAAIYDLTVKTESLNDLKSKKSEGAWNTLRNNPAPSEGDRKDLEKLTDAEKAAGKAAETLGKSAASIDEHLRSVRPPAGVSVQYVLSLKEAGDDFSKTLIPAGQSYGSDEIKSVKDKFDKFQALAEMLLKHSDSPAAEPLLNVLFRRISLGVAFGCMILAAYYAKQAAENAGAADRTISMWWAGAAAVLFLAAFASPSRSRFRWAGNNPAKADASLKYLVFGGLSFAVLAMLATGFFKEGATTFLSNIDGARGLITFIVAIGTMAIAVILVLASIIMDAPNTDELKERLSRGREILTVLVGVLGTIVGFYFASNTAGQPGSRAGAGVQGSVNESTAAGSSAGGSNPVRFGSAGASGSPR